MTTTNPPEASSRVPPIIWLLTRVPIEAPTTAAELAEIEKR